MSSNQFRPPRPSRLPRVPDRYPARPTEPLPPRIATLAEWSALGDDLARLGTYRLAIGGHAARAAASGGGHLTPHEVDQLVAWFTQIVDEAIERGGGSGDDSDETAAAIWYVLIGDSHHDPQRVRPPRCPAIAEVPGPGEEGFLAALRAGAAGYMHTAIAGASEDEIAALCWLVVAVDDEIELCRPLGAAYLEEEAPASELITSALSDLVRRWPTNAAVCRGVEGWARGFAAMVTEHAIPPVDRIGAIAWLARVAFRDEECAA